MEIKLKVKDVVDAWESLRALAGRKLKIQPSFWLGRQIKRLKATYESYEDSHGDLVKELGAQGENGKEWRVKKENEKEFAAKIKDLLDADVTETIEPRPVAFLALEEIEPAILFNLWFLFTDEEPPSPTAPTPKEDK